jgi:hypothetical protein
VSKQAVAPRIHAKAKIIDNHNASAVGLPSQYQPGLPTVGGADGVIRSYVLPGNSTGVVSIFPYTVRYPY